MALWKNSQFCGFLWKLCEKTLFYHAVPAAPPSDAPHPAAPHPPFCLEDNTVFTEFWRIKGKCCIREMYSRTSGGAIYVFIEKKYSD